MVIVVMRKMDKREKLLPYVPKLVTEINLAVQRVAVIWPVEEQVDSNNADHVEAQLDGDNREQAQEGQADAET